MMKSAKRKLTIESIDEYNLKGKCQECANFKIDLNTIDDKVNVHTCKRCSRIVFINSIKSFNKMLNSFQSISQKETEIAFDFNKINSTDKCTNDFIYEPFNIGKNDILPLESVYASAFTNEKKYSFKDLVNSLDNFKKSNQFVLKSKKFHVSGYSSSDSLSNFTFNLKKYFFEISEKGKYLIMSNLFNMIM